MPRRPPIEITYCSCSTKAKFDKRELKTRFPGLDVSDTYSSFAQTLYTRLGIGANGDGSKALRLLARIQTGQEVKTVDGLYKSMVLEEPVTYAAADKAIAHFADLERSYEAMVTEDQKAKVLERLPDLHRDFETATANTEMIDIFGIHRDGDTPFIFWRLRTERGLLDQAADTNRVRRGEANTTFTTTREQETQLKTRIAELQRQQRENGGDVLISLQADLEALALNRDEALQERAKFDQRIQPLSVAIRSVDEFAQIQTTAKDFMESFTDSENKLEGQRSSLPARGVPARNADSRAERRAPVSVRA